MLPTGELRQAIVSASRAAIAKGALVSIPTNYEVVPDGGIDFFVRVIDNLARKDFERRAEADAAPHGANPFLPYDEDLFVADLTETHVGLLNKYNVVDHHLLMVTRRFEDQNDPLTRADFEVMWRCLADVNGLVFYNGGVVAGASQPHKHLQMVPLPLAPAGPPTPMDPLFAKVNRTGTPSHLSGLPLRHSFVRLTSDTRHHPPKAAGLTLALFQRMCAKVRIAAKTRPDGGTSVITPYNLLVTRRWMLLVPRAAECFDSVSLNSLAFAGALLVRTRSQLSRLKAAGPMTALAQVAFPMLP